MIYKVYKEEPTIGNNRKKTEAKMRESLMISVNKEYE